MAAVGDMAGPTAIVLLKTARSLC